MELTSDSIALDFFIWMYLDLQRKGTPIGSNAAARNAMNTNAKIPSTATGIICFSYISIS